MTEEDILNLLILGIVAVWACKIAFHFAYLKAVDSSIKELNFFSFYRKLYNFPTGLLVIFPIFISRTDNGGEEIRRKKNKARLSTCILLTMWILTIFYLYNHPQ